MEDTGPQFQAFRGFTAGDVCFSDGAKPLSFQVGDIFRFLRYRDKRWMEVERTIRRDRPLITIEHFPVTETGVIPVDYVLKVSMDVENRDLESEEKDLDAQDTMLDHHDSLLFKVQTENEELKTRLVTLEQQYEETLQENQTLQERCQTEYKHFTHLLHDILQQYSELGEVLASTKEDLHSARSQLSEEKNANEVLEMTIKMLKRELGEIEEKEQTESQENEQVKTNQEGSEPEMLHPVNGDVPRSKQTDSELLVSCTLCQEKLRIDELESHSRYCATHIKNHQSKPVTPTPDMLVVRVTRPETSEEEKNVPFKVVTKTSLPSYAQTFYDVQRTEAEFEWLRQALEDACPECIVPPLVSKTLLHEKSRELQRFLSRVCCHKLLRTHRQLQLFLTGTTKDLVFAKEELKKKRSFLRNHEIDSQKTIKDEEGALAKCQRYLELFCNNMSGLIHHLNENLTAKTGEGSGYWFKQIAEAEPQETYLKKAAIALSNMCDVMDNSTEADELLIVTDLESVLEYAIGAQAILKRVEDAAAEFVYWDSQVKECEEMKKPGAENIGINISQKWATANSNCTIAKTKLEMMCRDLSLELTHFDTRKEKELHEIFTEYAALRSEHYEKVQSKWYGVKLMVETTPIVPDVRAVDFVR